MNSDFQKRLANAGTVRGSNSFGTALYLSGMRDDDTPVMPNFVQRVFESAQPLSSPEEGALAFLADLEKFWHAGVVVQTEPLEIVYRTYEGNIAQGGLPDFVERFMGRRVDVVYYQPREIFPTA